MLVISEFVGCSPSLSGAIRVNPWNVDSVADGIYSAIKMPLADRHLRHLKHWRYVSAHTAAFWVKVCCTPLTCQHSGMHQKVRRLMCAGKVHSAALCKQAGAGKMQCSTSCSTSSLSVCSPEVGCAWC